MPQPLQVLLNIVEALFVCYAIDRDRSAVTKAEVHEVFALVSYKTAFYYCQLQRHCIRVCIPAFTQLSFAHLPCAAFADAGGCCG